MASWNFPEEVITEILSWVPVKSLMRFKCVSKPWLHLISTDPHFMKLHFNHSFLQLKNSNPGIFLSYRALPGMEFYYAEDYTSVNELARFENPFLNPRCCIYFGFSNGFTIVNVCNGLVCLTDYYRGGQPKAHVWNPLTGDHITILFPSIPSHYSKYYVMYGFGFNQASDEYKFIRFLSPPPEEQIHHQCLTHVSVYTLGTGSWRNLERIVSFDTSCINYFPTALVNGALHWFGSKLGVSDGMYSIETLIAFNMQDENFQEFPLPDRITRESPFRTRVGELGGLLCIFCSFEDHKYLDIWVMEEYGVADSWRKFCKIEQTNAGTNDYLVPLVVADNGDIIISKNNWEWISYDPKTNSVRDLHRFEFPVIDTLTFKGSLLSPSIINNYQQSQQSSQMID